MSRVACPVEKCEKDYADEPRLAKHIEEKHPDYEPVVVPDEGGDDQDPSEETKKIERPEEPDNPDKGDTGPNLEAENKKLRELLGELQRKLADEEMPAVAVEAITDAKLIPLVKKCAKILWDRNKCLEQADRRKKDADFDAYDKLLSEANVFELEAVKIAAEVACVQVKDIFCKSKHGPLGEEILHGYGINVREGTFRVVLQNGARLKVFIADVNRAKWDYVHDQGEPGMRVANRRPDGWKGRTTVPIMRS